MAITFGENQYGKAEVRLVHVTRDGDRHQIKDLNVSTALRGDFAAAHLEGDNAHVVATDTQKNTVYAFAQQYGVGEIEAFALRLGRHFTDSFEWVTGAKISIEEYGWDRIVVDGAEHGHAFSRAGGGTRTTVVTIDGTQAWVVSGLTDLVVLKSTGFGVHRVPARPLHHAGRDHRSHPGDRGHRPLALCEQRRRLGAELRRRAAHHARGVRRPSTAWPCSRPFTTWASRSWWLTRRWPRSGCRCRTSITSWWT